jgi:hypothetical protein
MKHTSEYLFLLMFLLFLGCSKKEETTTNRPFYLSFTPFPHEISVEAVDYAYTQIGKDADMITHSFDEGVPWVEALSNQPFSKYIQDDWNLRKTKTPSGHKVFVQQSAISFLRTGLALYRKDANDLPLPKPWDTIRFNHLNVKTAYLNYCKRQIDFFKPDYYGFSIEPNILLSKKPTLWNDYKAFHQFIYQELKKTYPTLPLLYSTAGSFLLRGYEDNVDYDAQEQAQRDLLPFTDIFGVSLYIYGSKVAVNATPSDVFDKLKAFAKDKPMCMTETGFISKDLILDLTPTLRVTIASNEQKQADYMTLLLESATKHQFLFVNNFILRDYDKLWQQAGGKNDISALWRNIGLYDTNGQAKKAYPVWLSYFKKGYSR